MPNGDGLSDQQFAALDRELSVLDSHLNAFAGNTNGQSIRNYHGAERRIEYHDADGLHRAILISPVTHGRSVPEFILGVAAWRDHPRRSWHRIFDRRTVLPDSGEIGTILRNMYELVTRVTDADLE